MATSSVDVSNAPASVLAGLVAFMCLAVIALGFSELISIVSLPLSHACQNLILIDQIAIMRFT